jgi:hypothetical protein
MMKMDRLHSYLIVRLCFVGMYHRLLGMTVLMQRRFYDENITIKSHAADALSIDKGRQRVKSHRYHQC